jgi:hypothetical protein
MIVTTNVNSTKNGLLLTINKQGYFRIWSSSCKSVHKYSNISYIQVNTRTHTQPGIRDARRLAPLATPHTICIETPG